MFSNDDYLIYEVNNIKHEKLSDHDTLVVNLSNINEIDEKKREDKMNFCTTKIPEYETDIFEAEIFANKRVS